MGRLDPGWGIGFKALDAREATTDRVGNVRYPAPQAFVLVRVTLAFERDAADVAAVRSAFAAQQTYYSRRAPVPRVGFYLFDADALHTAHLHRVEGEITGVAGDAFRVVFHCDPELYRRARRIDLRFPGAGR